MKFFGIDGSQEPTIDQVHAQQGRRPSTVEAVEQQIRRKSVDNHVVTGASGLTTRQSIVPVTLVTILVCEFLMYELRDQHSLTSFIFSSFFGVLLMDCSMS